MQVTFDNETCQLIDQIKGDKSRFAWFRKEFKELLKENIQKNASSTPKVQNTRNAQHEGEYEVTTHESRNSV